MPRPIKAIINRGALRRNLQVVRGHAPRAAVFAVIKANAYGHGLIRAAHAFAAAEGYAVLEIDAAVRLREAGFSQRIALLEGAFELRDLAIAAKHRLAVAVHSEEQVRMLDGLGSPARVDVLLKLNTGMNRLGIAPVRFAAVLERLHQHPRVGGLMLMTHFANADDATGVGWQMARLERVAAGCSIPRSLANSAAVLRYPETHADWVRPGIMLYGCSPFADVTAKALRLEPAMTFSSAIIAVQQLEAGDRVGYGATFEAQKATRAGVVACGYADGYPRHAPTGTPVVVGNTRTQTLGRVSMDMLCVDITSIPDAEVGTEVTLWGSAPTADEVAAAAGTVSYELLCAVAPRVPVVEA
jgi:alanine racemase